MGDTRLNNPLRPLPDDAIYRQTAFTCPHQGLRKESQVRSETECLHAICAMLRRTPSGRKIRLRVWGEQHHNDSVSIRVSCRRCCRVSAIEFLCLEGLVRMAVALHANQFAYPASARMIALAIQNKVDGLGRLRTDERVI